MAVDKVEPFPILEARPSARLEALLPSQLYILDLLPPDQSAKLLAWCQTQQLEGPKPAKKGEAERTASACVPLDDTSIHRLIDCDH